MTSWRPLTPYQQNANRCYRGLATFIGIDSSWQRVLAKDLSLENWEQQLGKLPFIAVTDSRSLYDTITKCRNTSAHIDDKRTAIDLTILKGDLETTGGQVRWVGGSNMVSDSLTKRAAPKFLSRIMHLGKWSLTETGYKRLVEIHALFNTSCGACGFV